MTQNTHANQPHILPLSLYLGIGAILICLTVLTVYVAGINFGPYNLVIAMVIAIVKASLVALFFMHLKYDNKLYMLFFLSALFFLGVFIIITMFDTLRRGDIYEIKDKPLRNAVIYDSLRVAPQHHDIEDSLSESHDTTTIELDTHK